MGGPTILEPHPVEIMGKRFALETRKNDSIGYRGFLNLRRLRILIHDKDKESVRRATRQMGSASERAKKKHAFKLQ